MGHSQSAAIYEQLKADQEAIEVAMGLQDKLNWPPLPDKKSCRIAPYKEIGTLEDRDQWPAAYTWMLDWAEKFKAACAQRVNDIELPEPVNVEVEGAKPIVGASSP